MNMLDILDGAFLLLFAAIGFTLISAMCAVADVAGG